MSTPDSQHGGTDDGFPAPTPPVPVVPPPPIEPTEVEHGSPASEVAQDAADDGGASARQEWPAPPALTEDPAPAAPAVPESDVVEETVPHPPAPFPAAPAVESAPPFPAAPAVESAPAAPWAPPPGAVIAPAVDPAPSEPAPAVDPAPSEPAPAVDAAPAEPAPAVDEAPAQPAPAVDEAPAQPAPVQPTGLNPTPDLGQPPTWEATPAVGHSVLEPEPIAPEVTATAEPIPSGEPAATTEPAAAPSPQEQLVQQAASALAEAAAARQVPWSSAHLEWSQAGAQHSGRAYLGTEGGIVRIDLPDQAIAALAQLRVLQADPEKGAWYSALLDVTPDGGHTVTNEWSERPFWNSPGLRMVPAPGEPRPDVAVPSDEQWLSDLATYPRSGQHVPVWLQTSTANPGAAAAALRDRLAASSYPAEAVILPDREAPADALEGAMEVRQIGTHRFGVGVRDYGVFEVLHTAQTEREACDWLWNYLLTAPPGARPVPRYDLEQRSSAYRPAYAQIYAQLQAGGGAMVTTLQPGVALDRIGAIDGVFLFPWATPLPARALPPNSSPNARLYQFVTTQPLLVEAEIVQPWFGQPGGSLRFRIATDGVGTRQLLLNGALLEVTVGP